MRVCRTILLAFLAVVPGYAPVYVGIDEAPVVRLRLVRAIAAAENCAALNNPGCLRQRDGHYRRYRTPAEGMRALVRLLDHRRGQSVRTILECYNPGVAGYPDRVLALAGLRGGEIFR